VASISNHLELMSSFLINLVMNAGLILIIVYIVNLLYFMRFTVLVLELINVKNLIGKKFSKNTNGDPI